MAVKTYTITETAVYRVTIEDDEHPVRIYDLLDEYLKTGEPVAGVVLADSNSVVTREKGGTAND